MRKAGEIVGKTLALLKASVEPGMTTRDLDRIAFKEITRSGASPTFKGYRGFPATICTSVNEEIVHGIPGRRKLQEGDIIKVDVGATIEGFIGDAAVTIAVGEVPEALLALMEDTRLGLEEGIKAAVPGARVGDIGAAVQEYGESRGYGVVREFVGHGVGRFLHEDPQVPNYGWLAVGHCCAPVCASPLSLCSMRETGGPGFWMMIGLWSPRTGNFLPILNIQ
ncbi:Methionine aminopeptidase [Geodia barretti]|uniref:Methionine aminopeptidase n=1 Tax=Geodia barretti TaxID=519541 RepID=A0AA35X5R3_GEOBA|nr:Methionine aminopeptidase [Geodia barretti]